VNFTGGEPTLIPGFLDLLKFTKKLGYKIYVGTSGVMFSSEIFAQEALKYINELSLSVHWYSLETCGKQTGMKWHFNNFPTIARNIEKYKTDNYFFLNIVINTYNYTDVEKIMDFVMNSGYNFQQALVSNIAPEGSAKHNYKDLAFDLNDFKNFIP